ncbi:MAG: glycine zipper family protein [Marinibacterium sp.]|nr:glycine zipper family protein [Marinibacterium sp.]
MTKPLRLAALPLVLLAAACSNSGANYVPVIDGTPGPNFNVDLAECQQLAASQPALGPGTGSTVATTTGVAAAGAAITNNKGNNVLEAAAVGAVAGLGAAGLEGQREKERIIRNCMRGRGYKVVG